MEMIVKLGANFAVNCTKNTTVERFWYLLLQCIEFLK